jgi:hypothetical protein
LDFDDQIGLVQAALQSQVVARELRDEEYIGPIGIGLGSALLRCQRSQIGNLALASPAAQRGRVHTLSAHQRTDLAWVGAAVSGRQNAALVSGGEMPASGNRHDLRARVGRHGRRPRYGRIFSRPTGSLRCLRIGKDWHCVHGNLGLMKLRHYYLFAH